MYITRKIEITCFIGDGIESVKINTIKIRSNQPKTFRLQSLYSPILISDAGGLSYKIYADGRIRKIKKGYRKQQELEEKYRSND